MPGYGSWGVEYAYRPRVAGDAGGVGGAVATTGTLNVLPVTDHPKIVVDRGFDMTKTARAYPILNVNDVKPTKRRYSLDALPVYATAHLLADLFYGLFQSVTEGGTALFTKTFAPTVTAVVNIETAQAISAAQLPHVLDIVRFNSLLGTTVDEDQALGSAIPTEITLSMQNGTLMVTVNLVAFTADIDGFSMGAATYSKVFNSAAAYNQMNNFFFSCNQPSSDTVYDISENFSLTIRNGARLNYFTKAGPQSMTINAGGWDAEAQVSIPLDKAALIGFDTSYESKEIIACKFFGPLSTAISGPAIGDFGVTMNAIVDTQPVHASEETTETTTVHFKLAQTGDSGTANLGVTVSDGTSRSW